MNEYKDFLDKHYGEFGLGSKAWWVKYVYHFSDIHNIVGILKKGFIYSRNTCVKLGIMENENAGSQIIDQTDADIKNYVRLYFRPKTPTQ